MEIQVSHHVDEAAGQRYEYELYEFVLGTRTVRARRYAQDEPGAISILGMFGADAPGVPVSLYEAPEAAEIIAALAERGFKTISVLGPQGYAPLDQERLGLDQ